MGMLAWSADRPVVVRGGGDLGTGVAHRLHSAGLPVWVTEVAQPLAVRRAVAFAEAVYAGQITVEGVTARRAADLAQASEYARYGTVPVLVDAAGDLLQPLQPLGWVDARMLKTIAPVEPAAPWVIGLGPGFCAGQNCRAVVETQRGHNLGRVYWAGRAEPDTGQPESVAGVTDQRVLRAPQAGVFWGRKQIGDSVTAGESVGRVEAAEVVAQCNGVVRGVLHAGLSVPAGLKVGDIDPRGVRAHCFLISDKARAVGGGALEAVLASLIERPTVQDESR